MTVGVLGSLIGVECSLTLSAAAAMLVPVGSLAADVRGRRLLTPPTESR